MITRVGLLVSGVVVAAIADSQGDGADSYRASLSVPGRHRFGPDLPGFWPQKPEERIGNLEG